MKKAIVITILIFGSWHCFSQDFVNLNFENAIITPDPSSYIYPDAVYASNAIPGWTATGFLGPKDVLYDSASLGSTSVSILDADGFPPALDGEFSVYLYGGGTATAASISQTGIVPCPQNPFFLRRKMMGIREEYLWFLWAAKTCHISPYQTDQITLCMAEIFHQRLLAKVNN